MDSRYPHPWHPCNTPRGSPYRLLAPVSDSKNGSPCPWMGCTSTYHTKKNDTIVLEFHCTCFIDVHLEYLKASPNSCSYRLWCPVHLCRNFSPLADHPLLLCMSLLHCLQASSRNLTNLHNFCGFRSGFALLNGPSVDPFSENRPVSKQVGIVATYNPPSISGCRHNTSALLLIKIFSHGKELESNRERGLHVA